MKTSLTVIIAAAVLVLSAGCQKTNPTPEPPAPTVKAGASQTITLPLDSVKLSGSATAPSKITAYLWSEVSGPNVPVITSEGSPATTVHGLIAGKYIFQLMAVDSTGETGVDTLTVSVLPALVVPTTMIDTLRTSFNGTTPYELKFLSNPTYSVAGSAVTTEMLAEDWTINGIEVWGRAYMKFDLSKIPAGTKIKSAVLTLFSDPAPQNGDLVHANSGTNNDFYLQRITSNWDLSGTTTWNNLPVMDTVAQAYVPQTNQPFLDIQVDITRLANNWMTNGNNGLGMRLKTEVMYNTRIFCSSYYADVTRRPYLVITY